MVPCAMRPQLSLKGCALQLLAQREQSRLELRRKLLRRLREDASPGDIGAQSTLANRHAEVEAVLDWLQAHRYLSDERFAESRVHARAARFGNLRIRQELSQHGVELTSSIASDLRESEQARAREVQQRKFGSPPATPTDRARQARFLAGRGFSAEVVWQVLRGAADSDAD